MVELLLITLSLCLSIEITFTVNATSLIPMTLEGNHKEQETSRVDIFALLRRLTSVSVKGTLMYIS